MIKKFICGEIEENCYIVYDGTSAVVIDPGEATAEILSFLRGKKVEYILLTHGHYDHIGGAEALRSITGAPVLCHEDEKIILENGEYNLGVSLTLTPDRLYRDGEELHSSVGEFRFMHTPGHTVGSSVIFYGDSIFSGDTLFLGGYGRTDFPTGDFGALKRSLRALFGLKTEYTVYPGHGESTAVGGKK